MKQLFILQALLLLFTVSVQAQRLISVEHNGISRFYPGLQDAINQASAGSIIHSLLLNLLSF